MKKRQIVLLIIVELMALVGLGFLFFYKKGTVKEEICCSTETENVCFNVEIADDDESRARGLMFRESLPENDGMLFIFDEPDFYPFWMKNTLIPLAGIWMDENMVINDIILMNLCAVEKCPSYIPQNKAKYVLEINQKWISEYDRIHTGFNCWLN